jgi:hypothetical protein
MSTTWSVGLEASTTPSVVAASEPAPERSLTVFPNPAHDLITIGMDEYAAAHSAQIVLFDALGRTATQFSYVFSPQEQAEGKAAYHLAIGYLPRGMYLLQIRLNHQTLQRKIVLH